MLPHQFCRELLQPLRVPFREFALQDDVLTFEITKFLKLSHKRRDEKRASAGIEQSYSEGMLRPRGERPNGHHAAEKPDELSSLQVTHQNSLCAILKTTTLRPGRECGNGTEGGNGTRSAQHGGQAEIGWNWNQHHAMFPSIQTIVIAHPCKQPHILSQVFHRPDRRGSRL